MDWFSGIVLMGLCLLGQAFFAGSEMGLISFNRIRLRHMVEQGDRKAAAIEHLLDNPQRLFGTTLVGVNVCVIVGATVASSLVNTHVTASQNWGAIIATAVMLPLTVMFGEIVPMSIFRSHSTALVRLVIMWVRRAYWVLLPAVSAATFISQKVAGLFGGQKTRGGPFSSRDELRLVLEGRTKGEFLHKDGVDMLRRIFDLQDTRAREVMVPLIDVVASRVDSTVQEVKGRMKKSGFSTIPLFEERVDNIVGTVNAADLMGIEDQEKPARSVANEPYIVPESKPVDEIIFEFQQQAKRFAVVVDEYGGVSGILTLEDIVEEIVGEIADEYEGAVPPRITTRKGMVLVEGRMDIGEFNDEFSTDFPEDEAETIGGLLTAITGRVHQPGEKILSHGVEFEILEASDRRVSKVIIKPLTKGKSDSK
jgi:putative hemolysin